MRRRHYTRIGRIVHQRSEDLYPAGRYFNLRTQMKHESSAPVVQAGHVHTIRFFDIAYGIDLAEVERLALSQGGASARIRLVHKKPKAIAFDVPPVELRWKPIDLPVAGVSRQFEVTCRVYDFGVVSVELRLNITSLPWEDFATCLNAVGHESAFNEAWKAQWKSFRKEATQFLAPALNRPGNSGIDIEEDYLIGQVRRFEEDLTESELSQRIDLAAVLSGEDRQLAISARCEILRHRFSYYENDLVALTWDRAFIYEPTDDTGVLDVLQMANAQFVELRYYDELLDREIQHMYKQVQGAHSRFARFYSHLARSLHTLVGEVVEVRERLDNALQVTDDVYFARIHAAAMKLFRVPDMERAVDRKLASIRETYTALYDEAATKRSEVLEATIVLLIVLEMGIALLWH